MKKPDKSIIELWAPTPEQPWERVGSLQMIFVPRQFDSVRYYHPVRASFVEASVIRVIWCLTDLDRPIVQVYLTE